MKQHPAIPWVLPFAVFMLALSVTPLLGLPPHAELVLRFALPALALLVFSRDVLKSALIGVKFDSFTTSVLVGASVFAIWVAPDMLWPGYRDHWLFQNAVTGTLASSLAPEVRSDGAALLLRILRAVILVPIVEELFWRGWMMRWLIRHDFLKVPLGEYARMSFWATAGLFAIEHGPYWEVGFLAGTVYNYWMVRTKSLKDVILAHAVTNACLAAYVLRTGRWEFWM